MLTPHCWLVPHLPTLLLDEVRGEATDMLSALEVVRARFVADAPEVIVALSARWESEGPFLAGDAAWHAGISEAHGLGVELRYEVPGEPALARAIAARAQRAGLAAAASAVRGIDSGIAVPLHFLAPERRIPVVPLSLAPAPADAHRRWGAAVRVALAAWPQRVAFVVGGMLSHNVHAWSLHREVPEARVLDERLLEQFARGDWRRVGALAAGAPERAQAEAGLRHLEVLRGVLSADIPGMVACYEPAPGLGAALVEWTLEPAPTSR